MIIKADVKLSFCFTHTMTLQLANFASNNVNTCSRFTVRCNVNDVSPFSYCAGEKVFDVGDNCFIQIVCTPEVRVLLVFDCF